MLTPRSELASGVLAGRLYALGGFSAIGRANTVEAYDPSTNAWATMAPMPHPRFAFAAGATGRTLFAVDGCCDRNNHEVRTLFALTP
jgi:hypothetical protein